MAEENNIEEFLNSWFPDLDDKSYIIPVAHFDHVRADKINSADVSAGVLKPDEDCAENRREMKTSDHSHKTVHAMFTKLKDHTAKDEVMVMTTQARFSMYSSLVAAASASVSDSRKGDLSKEDIKNQKNRHYDHVVVNKQRGVLVGVVQSFHVADPSLARQKLEESVTYLTEAARIIQEVVRTVPGADKVAVHTTLVLPNITRADLEESKCQLQTVVQGVSCLCKDQMVNDQCLERWWEESWSSRHLDFMEREVYRGLVARFAIPATRVEIYLTTQPRLQLKHEHDVVNAVGDVHGAEVFQAGLHQLSLFPTQAKLLDSDYLDETDDDVKFLLGPPGTGKTILLVLRALQWVKHFGARHIFILQTIEDANTASYMVEYQLQQTLNAQQQRAQQTGTDTQNTQCPFTHVDMSEMWKDQDIAKDRHGKVVLKEGGKEKLYTALGLQQRGQSDTAIHIVADEADGDVVAAVYPWLKEKGVTTVRLWAAGVEAFRNKSSPASLQVCHVTEPLRCPGRVVQEVMRADQMKRGRVPPYDAGWRLTGGPPVVELKHYDKCRDGHVGHYPWRCGQCGKNIAAQLRSLHVGEADEGRQGLSARDVFILGSLIECDEPEDEVFSPEPLMGALYDCKYRTCVMNSAVTRDQTMTVVRKDIEPPALIMANERYVRGLERKIVVYFDCGLVVGGGDADLSGRLRGFSKTTSLLIYIKIDLSS